MRLKIGSAALVASVICACCAAGATGATLTVTTTTDQSTPGDGLCALREAIIAVDSPGTSSDCGTADDGANTIVLGAHNYALTLAFPHLIMGPLPTGCFAGVTHPDNNLHGDLTITANVQNLTIEGAGAGQTIIDACKLEDRAFNILAGASVAIRGLTITNGNVPGGAVGTSATTPGQNGTAGSAGLDGGGILNAGSLSLTDVTVSNSHAGFGGSGGNAVNADTGDVTGGSGGTGGTGGSGGGIYNSGTLSVTDSTISDNGSGGGGFGGGAGDGHGTGGGGSGGSGGLGGRGAGIASTGSLTITGTTIDDNTAATGGTGEPGADDDVDSTATGGNGGNGGGGGDDGGVAALGGSLSITNSTITGNFAGAGGTAATGGNGQGDVVFGGSGGNGGAGGDGGGIGTAGLSASSLVNVTIADNGIGAPQTGAAGGSQSGTHGATGAKGHGAGVFALAIGAKMTLQNSILDANSPGLNCGTNALSSSDAFADGGHNLSFAPLSLTGLNSGPGCPSTFSDGDPKLGPLQNNLGPTETMAPQAGSAAIDQVPATGAGCPSTDQRGLTRPSGPACDIGAYEVTPPAVGRPSAGTITVSGATLRDTLTANAVTATAEFEFGTTTSYGSKTNVQTVNGLNPSMITASLSGLKSHTTYHYRVTATSNDGTTTSADATFTTSQIPPKLSGLKVKRKRGTTTVKYSDSLAARTTVIVFELKPGIEQKHKCTKASKRLKGKACSRLVRVKRLTHADKRGSNSFSLKRLASGRYLLKATPSVDGVTGKTVSKRFRVTSI